MMIMTGAWTSCSRGAVTGARRCFSLLERRGPKVTFSTSSFPATPTIVLDNHYHVSHHASRHAILPHPSVRRCGGLLCRRTFASTTFVSTSSTSSPSSSSSSASSSSSSSPTTTTAIEKDDALVQWNLDNTTRIGTITLNSPHNLNALSMEMGMAFSQLCHTLIQDLTLNGVECHAIIIQGSGTDAFSAGGPLEWLKSFKHNSVHHNADLMVQFYRKFLMVRQLPVPTIAALQGPAVGAGAGLALACDLRTAAPKSKILGLNFAKLGLHAGMGGSHLLEMALGGPAAKTNEILLLGQMLSGQQSYDLGLVNRLEHDAKAAAHQMAMEIGTQHPVAIRTMVQTLRQRQDVGLEAALQREALSQAVCYNRSDWGEGMDAVVEKRAPNFHAYHEP